MMKNSYAYEMLGSRSLKLTKQAFDGDTRQRTLTHKLNVV